MSYSSEYRSGDRFSDDDEEAELVAKTIEQIEINRMKIARIGSVLTIERIHAIIGGICLLIIAGILVFSVFATFYPYITRVDIDPQVFVALIIPAIVLGGFGFLTFFTDAIARIHELRELQRWNRRVIDVAYSALHSEE